MYFLLGSTFQFLLSALIIITGKDCSVLLPLYMKLQYFPFREFTFRAFWSENALVNKTHINLYKMRRPELKIHLL